MGVDKTWAQAQGPAHGLPCGLPPKFDKNKIKIKILLLIKNKNNYVLIYKLL